MRPVPDVPPFLPRITPAPLPTIQPTVIPHDFGLSAFVAQDIIMKEVKVDAIEGAAGLGEGIEGIGDRFEDIGCEEVATDDELI